MASTGRRIIWIHLERIVSWARRGSRETQCGRPSFHWNYCTIIMDNHEKLIKMGVSGCCWIFLEVGGFMFAEVAVDIGTLSSVFSRNTMFQSLLADVVTASTWRLVDLKVIQRPSFKSTRTLRYDQICDVLKHHELDANRTSMNQKRWQETWGLMAGASIWTESCDRKFFAKPCRGHGLFVLPSNVIQSWPAAFLHGRKDGSQAILADSLTKLHNQNRLKRRTCALFHGWKVCRKLRAPGVRHLQLVESVTGWMWIRSPSWEKRHDVWKRHWDGSTILREVVLMALKWNLGVQVLWCILGL